MAQEQGMEWKMEEKFSMEWNIFRLEWKWNGRKLPVLNMEKSSSIPFHTNDTTPSVLAYCILFRAGLILEIG